MSDVEIRDFEDKDLDELLPFLTKWSPDHPELGEGDIVKWQKCFRFVALHKGKIVGYIAQIAQEFKHGQKSDRIGFEKIGWGVTLVLDGSDNNIRKQAGRLLLSRCENNRPLWTKWSSDHPALSYAAVGVVPIIEKPYIRRGHVVRRDCSKMYARFMQPTKALRYMGMSRLYAPLIRLGNLICPRLGIRISTTTLISSFDSFWDEVWKKFLGKQKELYGIRNADYLNYKLTQPNRNYYVGIHHAGVYDMPDGYIIFRYATHRTKDLNLVKICDLVGTEEAKADLVALAVRYAYKVNAYGIVALGSYDEEKMYRKAGLYLSKPYPITMSPHIKAKMHITFFDSDLDNLW